jgi:hypothetical protein
MRKEEFIQNALVTIYEDWENEKNIIGTGILIEKRGNGHSFILKDTTKVNVPNTLTFHGQVVTEWIVRDKNLPYYNLFSYERWNILLTVSKNPRYKNNTIYTLNKRYLVEYTTDERLSKIIGKGKREDYLEDQEEEKYIEECIKLNKPIDKFLKVDGISIY